MPERIHKLQPNRTIQLRGFDDLGAGAAVHSATANSFKASGVFRDPGDFAVLVLYDADNFYEHPSLKYLPDTNFAGVTLSFDVHYEGLQPLDSAKYPTISWPYLEVIRPDGTTAQVHLFDHATKVSGTYNKAHTTITVEAPQGAQQYDRVTLWYLNNPFDYWVTEALTGAPASAADVALSLAERINKADFSTGQAIEAEANGSDIVVRAAKPGRDGNMLRLYTQSKNGESLKLTPEVAKFSGGSSDATWRVTLRFSDAIGRSPDGTKRDIEQIRQCWLTFAPPLADGVEFIETEWEATFTNWTVEGENQWLSVAGSSSLRIEESDPACRYSGSSWTLESGFFSAGFARRANTIGEAVTIEYQHSGQHDLWIGTSLRPGGGEWNVTLDGNTRDPINTKLEGGEPVNTRRLIKKDLPAGRHVLILQLRSGSAYFDFLEAAVPADIPVPQSIEADLAPALDYSTDHTYKLPPARILWMLDQLGYGGPLNLYMGVFWYNQRKRVEGSLPSVTVTFGGEFAKDYQVLLSIGGQVAGKGIFPADVDNAAGIAKHLEYFINATYVGVWAKAQDNTLTITARSAKDAFSYDFRAWVEHIPETGGGYTTLRELEWTGSLKGGKAGIWEVDPEQEFGINRGARAWLSDMFSLLAQRAREIVVATSMELVFPPAGFPAAFPDGSEVITDIGFGSTLRSAHCAFNSLMLAHHTKVYTTIAGLMHEKGLTPWLQFGEFLWWFFPRKGLKPLAVLSASPIEIYFEQQHGLTTGDPIINGGYQGCTAANGTFTVTYVNDYQIALNGSTGNGTWVQGTGWSKAGGMGFYDSETKTAAQAALGRPLHVFQVPTDDPTINGSADAIFLRNRLRDYVAALTTAVRSTYPSARFELLWPYDVNHPQLAGINQLGGSLNRFVNLPVEWEQKQTSGLDRLKIEALDFGASNKNMDLVKTAIRFAVDLGWPRDSLRYLVPIFKAAYPWEKEYRTAKGLGYAAVNLWAFDHICIFGLEINPPAARAVYMG